MKSSVCWSTLTITYTKKNVSVEFGGHIYKTNVLKQHTCSYFKFRIIGVYTPFITIFYLYCGCKLYCMY